MPTYEYTCDTCAHLFEQFQGMTDALLKECPECGSDVRRIISTGAGVIFKGKGFYQTDYKKSAHQPAAEKGDTKKDLAPCGKTGACSSCEANA